MSAPLSDARAGFRLEDANVSIRSRSEVRAIGSPGDGFHAPFVIQAHDERHLNSV